MYNILTIGGTDPSGGAGIAADLKSFAAHCCYGMAVITAIVAQNSSKVKNFALVDKSLILEQIDAAFEEGRIDAVKLGMLATREISEVVLQKLLHYKASPIILDPVMTAKSGDLLIDSEAVAFMRQELFPKADITTPNLFETELLLFGSLYNQRPMASSIELMVEKATLLSEQTKGAILVKGGYIAKNPKETLAQDIFCQKNYKSKDNKNYEILSEKRVESKNLHGTGCTLSASIAALAPNHDMLTACQKAKSYLTGAIEGAQIFKLGKKCGPVNHLWQCCN